MKIGKLNSAVIIEDDREFHRSEVAHGVHGFIDQFCMMLNNKLFSINRSFSIKFLHLFIFNIMSELILNLCKYRKNFFFLKVV